MQTRKMNMTKETLPLALLNMDKAKGLHHMHGSITKVNSDYGADDEDTSTDDPSKDTQTGNPNDNKPNEDVIPAKRYFDLKSHHDKTVTDLRKEIAELKKVTPPQLEIPKTPEEVQNLRNKFPELVDGIISVVRMDLLKEREFTSNEIEELRKERKQLKEDSDREKVLKAHPDAESIIKSTEFAEWFNEQPKGIQNLLQSDDVQDTIKGFSLYKQEKGIKNPTAEAAFRVKTGTKTNPDPGKRVFYESEVAAMSERQYESLEKEILAARMDGRYLKG